MKKIIFFMFMLVVAVAVGIGVFVWSGGDAAEIRKKGYGIEKKLIEAGKRGGKTAISKTKKKLDKLPEAVRNVKKKADKKPTVKPVSVTPPSPPLSEINEKDRKKLKSLLKE